MMVFYYFVCVDGYIKFVIIVLVLGVVINILFDVLLVVYLEYGIKGVVYVMVVV